MATATVKMSLHLSNQTNDLLEQMCDDNQLTKSEFIRRAIALMGVAMNYKKKEVIWLSLMIRIIK